MGVVRGRPDLPKSKLPMKGKVSDAIKGFDNLIRLVYECRSYPNILKQRFEKEILGDKLEEQEEDSSLKFALFHVSLNSEHLGIITGY